MRPFPSTFIALALLPAAAACAPAVEPGGPPPPMATGECNNEGLTAFVGRKATPEAGAEMLAASGARTLRWVPPRTAVTMDFRADRLTVSYDDDMVIERASCG